MRRMFAAALGLLCDTFAALRGSKEGRSARTGALVRRRGNGRDWRRPGLARLRGYSAHEVEQGVEDPVLLLNAADPGREIASLLSVPAELRMVAAPNRDLERD